MLLAGRRVLARTCWSAAHAAAPSYLHRSQGRGQGRVRSAAHPAAAGEAAAAAAAAAGFRCGVGRPRTLCSCSNRTAEVAKPMEVEVKIRLPDKAAHDRIAQLLAPGIRAVHEQENFFFDGANKELNSQRAVLRLRFYDVDKKAVITVKGKQILQDGIGRASEVEEPADAKTARKYLDEPTPLLQESPLLKGLNERLGIQELVCMGGFRNRRQEISWEGETLELDETFFEHGTLYEIECETSQPEQLRDKLEAFLTSNGISYSYSSVSKFANFINRTLN